MRKELDKDILFNRICQMCESICGKKTHKQRIREIERLWVEIRDGHFYPFMRLILPHLDRERLTYGLKELKLAKYYVEILGLAPQSPDATILKKWKDPSVSRFGVGTSFSDAVLHVLQKRSWDAAGKGRCLSVSQINGELDALASAPDAVLKKRILLRLLQNTCAIEQKWLIRIILKDMKMHIQHNSILSAFHPHALDMYNTCSDLRKVCSQCQDPSFTFTSGSVELFAPLRPMLASVATSGHRKLLDEGGYAVEPKYDGERVLVHVHGETVRYYTRNAVDYTSIYGEHFSSTLLASIGVKSCILDGEMLVWDDHRGGVREFGHNRTLGRSETGEREWERFCYHVFDVLLVDGHVTTHLPLRDRRRLLKRTVAHPQPRSVVLVPQEPLSSSASLGTCLRDAVTAGWEGIMLKDVASPYAPASRTAGWLKLKPDHVDGMGETFDLVIVGGYYGTKFGERSITHFLIAVRQSTADRYVPVAKVGSGYSAAELRTLTTRLERGWEATVPGCLPPWSPAPTDRPDRWIHPSHSCVLEVRAFSLQSTTKFPAGHTLRFPRVLRVRPDKAVEDITTLETIQRQAAEGGILMDDPTAPLVLSQGRKGSQKGRKRRREGKETGHEGGETGRGGRRQVRVVGVYADTDTTGISVESSILSGVQVYVAHGGLGYSKGDLERMVVRLGGEKVQNPSRRTDYVLATRADRGVRLETWKEGGREGACSGVVVHLSWLLECVRTGTRIPLASRHLLHVPDHPHAQLNIVRDQYGDLYHTDVDPQSLKTILHAVGPVSGFTPAQMNWVDRRYNMPLIEPSEERGQPIEVPSEGLSVGDPRELEVMRSRVYGGMVVRT
eukprot:gb/GECH01003992.1/.p1 GENE.gb/GECH01003992.1/~~gb/GECH01003992.1/.p1  ORF type:complete len:842 (+),score=118.32 gb/GECH01003992.1/:1-2526(+)